LVPGALICGTTYSARKDYSFIIYQFKIIYLFKR